MKKLYLLLFLTVGLAANAQSVDYNVQDEFIAEGYDIVAYFSNSAKKGSTKYVATYDGVKFKFSSQENLETFNNNPKMYVPQYGGWCAYAMGVTGEKVSINPKTYEIRDGKLFLFYNSWGTNTLNSWLKTPEDFKRKADENWENVKNEK